MVLAQFPLSWQSPGLMWIGLGLMMMGRWMLPISTAGYTTGRLPVVAEEIEEATDLREAAGCGALPTDGGVRQQLERELECARLEQAGQVLRGKECSLVAAGSDSYAGSSGGSLEKFAVRSDGGFEAILGQQRLRPMVMCGLGLQSQRHLLLIQRGLRISSDMQTVLGPRRGLMGTLVQFLCWGMGNLGLMWAACLGMRHVSQVVI